MYRWYQNIYMKKFQVSISLRSRLYLLIFQRFNYNMRQINLFKVPEIGKNVKLGILKINKDPIAIKANK